MELSHYIRLLRRWIWLLVLAAFVTGGVTYIIRSSQLPVYRSQVTISIGGFLDSPDPNQSQIIVGFQLVETYARIVRTFDVLQSVADELDTELTPDQINSMIDTTSLSGTSLLAIRVSYTDPVLSADIANELARQLILASPTGLTPAQQANVDLLNSQTEQLTDELSSLRSQLQRVDEQLAQATDPEVIDQLNVERTTLVTQINEATSNIAQFTNTVAGLQQRTNSVEVVESARIPTRPIGQNVITTAILAAIVGAASAMGIVLVVEYMNDTFRTTDELTRYLNSPVLGVISRFGKSNDNYNSRLITQQAIFSQTPEEYSTLRTNLLYASQDNKKVYVVCSAAPREGKSVTAANLAVSMALAGLGVLLIDADLRRPRVHEIFGLKNDLGLTSLLSLSPTGEATPLQATDTAQMTDNWKQCVQKTEVPGLQVITSGFIPKNPAEILGSTLMRRWVDAFKRSNNIDIIIFDTPPSLAVSDAPVLAANTDAQVVIVIEAGKTRRNVALKAKERFTQVGVTVTGTVLNGANMREDDYYGYGYGYYYTPTDTKQPKQAPSSQ